MKRAHYSKRMPRTQDYVKFCGLIAWQSFFLNNFADFSNVVRVKKNQDFVQPLVAFPISNISYCVATFCVATLSDHRCYHIIIFMTCVWWAKKNPFSEINGLTDNGSLLGTHLPSWKDVYRFKLSPNTWLSTFCNKHKAATYFYISRSYIHLCSCLVLRLCHSHFSFPFLGVFCMSLQMSNFDSLWKY